MIELLSGILIGGAAGFVAKDKFFPDSKAEQAKQQAETLFAENEKFASRNKELERQVEDLLAEVSKVRKEAKRQDDEQDDME
ncbi:MAG: hypothetical protein IJU69_01275, partial [Bacteroidales bacterium]|nr:hypothetical protein [Bacteroidales bacterium]